MKYLLTIYGDESAVRRDARARTAARCRGLRCASARRPTEAGVLLGGEGLQPTATATTVRVRDGERLRHRRPVRRDQGAARRLLPARVQGPRRGDRVGGEDPGSAARLGRGAARSWTTRRVRAAAGRDRGDRERTPAVDRLFRRGVGAGGRDASSASLGDFDLAEEAVQDAFARRARALAGATGCPTTRRAWIITDRAQQGDRPAAPRAAPASDKRAELAGARGARQRQDGEDDDDERRSPTTACG